MPIIQDTIKIKIPPAIKTIPENLFANNPEVTSFEGVFKGASSISGTIPENLFVNKENWLRREGVQETYTI